MNSPNWKKNITIFLASQSISLFGSSLVQYAIMWYVTLETKSGIMLTIMTLCGFLPQLLISLFAGVWADRFNRKILIIIADGGIAISTLALALTVIFFDDFYWALFVASAVRSVGAGIQTPAVNALVPQIVPQDKLMKISGINGTLQSFTNLVAPAVAGVVLSWGELQNIMFIDVVTAIIGIGMLLLVPISKHKKALENKKGGYFSDLKAGLKYCLGNKFFRQLLVVSTFYCFLIVPAAMLNVLFVTRIFGEDYIYLTLNEMTFFIGAILGGFAISAWGGFKNRLKTLGWGGVVFGVTTIAMGLTEIFWVYLIIMVITGFAMPFNNVPLTVLVQEKADPDMQGRMFSIVQVIGACIMPLGMAIFGPLADIIPIKWLFVTSGIGLLILTIIVFNYKSFYKEGIKS
ncbi:MAG: MFS transporter [Clostridia bacterium]